jgi:hypothetical protein
MQHFAFSGIARLLGVAAVVALLGIGMCGFLSYFKFKSALEAATRARMAVPAAAVREGVEAVLGLGVPLAAAAGTPALLARERGVDAEIAAISVLDAQGGVLFSTDAARVGAPLEPLPAGEGELRAVLRNSFDLRQGEVVVRHVQRSSQRALERLRERLLAICVAGWAATVLLAALGLAVARRPAAAPG